MDIGLLVSLWLFLWCFFSLGVVFLKRESESVYVSLFCKSFIVTLFLVVSRCFGCVDMVFYRVTLNMSKSIS